jgi:hypothetical protein
MRRGRTSDSVCHLVLYLLTSYYTFQAEEFCRFTLGPWLFVRRPISWFDYPGVLLALFLYNVLENVTAIKSVLTNNSYLFI